MSSAFSYDAVKSYLTRVWDKKIHNGYITLETRIVMWYNYLHKYKIGKSTFNRFSNDKF